MARSPNRPVEITIRPDQGGRLITDMSYENVGAGNYLLKTNWRRVDDQEWLREGYLPFRPNVGQPENTQTVGPWTTDTVLGVWEALRPNGQRAVIVATATTIYKFDYVTGTWTQLGTGYSTAGRRWQAESIDGYLVLTNGVDLPFYVRAELNVTTPIYTLRENGVATAQGLSNFNGFLLLHDVSNIAESELAGIMNGPTPYGPVTDLTKINRIRYRILWSDLADPINFAPLLEGTIQSASKNQITLPFPSSVFVPGTKIAVIGAGIDGGILGGDDENPDGVEILSVVGNVLTISVPADDDLTYPLTVQVTRFTDLSTFSGYFDIQDDSSGIIVVKPLNNGLLAVYKETGIFHGRYTGLVETPFAFIPKYSGRNVPFYPDSLLVLGGDRHVYATENDFYVYDGAGDPTIFAPLHDARSLFFSNLVQATAWKAFAAHNPITKELWWFCPDGVLALDYVRGTVSWIDVTFTAASYIRKPDGTNSTGPAEYWFVHAKDGQLFQYGLVDHGTATYTRNGAFYRAFIGGGLNAAGDENTEKQIDSYIPLMSSSSDHVNLEYSILGTDNVTRPAEVLCSGTIIDPSVQNAVHLFYQNIYFRDELSVEARGHSMRLSGRMLRAFYINSNSVTR